MKLMFFQWQAYENQRALKLAKADALKWDYTFGIEFRYEENGDERVLIRELK